MRLKKAQDWEGEGEGEGKVKVANAKIDARAYSLRQKANHNKGSPYSKPKFRSILLYRALTMEMD